MQINANTLRIYSTRVRRLTTKGIYCKAKYLAAVLDSHEHRAEYALDLEVSVCRSHASIDILNGYFVHANTTTYYYMWNGLSHFINKLTKYDQRLLL